MAQILIIDDDQQMRSFLQRLLSQEGHEVEEAENGYVALKIIRKNLPDLVITDIFMPEQEGISTIMTLKEKHPQIKIIAISGGGSIPDVNFLELAQALGAHKALQKPFKNEEMVTAVRDLLQ